MLLILAKILLLLGAAVLVSLIIKVALLTLKAVLTKIKEKLKAKFGTKVFVASVKKLAKEITMEAERKRNIHSVDGLLKELGKEGIVTAVIDENGKIENEDIEITRAENIDDKLADILKQNDDGLVLA